MKKNLQGLVPLLFSSTFVALILVAGYFQLRDWSQPAFVVGTTAVAIYLLWLVLESRVAAGETQRERTKSDIGTCEAYALGRALTTLLALAMPRICSGYYHFMLAGLILFVCGITFRLVAIRTLGRFYSHRVRIAGDHQVVDTGPYRFLRHPAYTGMLVAHLGFVLIFMNLWAAIAWLVLLITIIIRIRVEEKALFELPGYPEFAAKRCRLLPGLW